MNEELKEILIAKMLDAPHSLSDEDLGLILNDDELHDIYEVSVALSSTYINNAKFDMEYEWARFRPRIYRNRDRTSWVIRIVAIFLGIIIVSRIAVHIIDNKFTKQPLEIAMTEQYKELENASTELPNPLKIEVEEKPQQDPVIIGNHYVAKDENYSPQNIYTNEEINIDIDEYLRIQQASIDNELALQVSETLLDEINLMISQTDNDIIDNQEFEYIVKTISMQ